MPADDLYWNPMELDSDESLPYQKQYIDPWDLENYAYIRQHLESVDLNSDPSSLGEPQETSAFYYIPTKPTELPVNKISPYYETGTRPRRSRSPRDEDYYGQASGKYDTILRSEHGTASYAAIDELTIRNRRRQSQIYGNTVTRSRYEPDSIEEYDAEADNIYEMGLKEEQEMQPYDMDHVAYNRTMAKTIIPRTKTSRSRSYSYSAGDYEFDTYKAVPPPSHHHHQQSLYNIEEDIYVRPDYYDSTGSSPIYDDIKFHRPKPHHFKLSNYGHLQIDYSCSWNNLNKYIYN